jgi:hypothetical protein
MPRGDRTGPMGMGPMTGRAAGYCAGYPVPGYMNPGVVEGPRDWGFCGSGRGWRHRYYATGLPGWIRFGGLQQPVQNVDPEMEKQMLGKQAENLQAQLDMIKKRLAEMGPDSKAE